MVLENPRYEPPSSMYAYKWPNSNIKRVISYSLDDQQYYDLFHRRGPLRGARRGERLGDHQMHHIAAYIIQRAYRCEFKYHRIFDLIPEEDE